MFLADEVQLTVTRGKKSRNERDESALGRKERKNKVGTRPTVAMIYNKGNTLICELRRNFLIFPFILIYFWSNFRFDFAEGKKICFEQRGKQTT